MTIVRRFRFAHDACLVLMSICVAGLGSSAWGQDKTTERTSLPPLEGPFTPNGRAAAPGDWVSVGPPGEVTITASPTPLDPDAVEIEVALFSFDISELGTQTMAVYGAGLPLTPLLNYEVNISWDLYTWDSYSNFNGYWDVFFVHANSVGYYWDLVRPDPIADLACSSSFVQEGVQALPGPLWAFGGLEWGNGVLCNTTGVTTFEHFGVDTSQNVFLSVGLDTGITGSVDGVYPSWGTFQIEVIQTGQVPITTTVLDAGIPDGFTPPSEPPAPEPELAALLLDCPEIPLQFDELAQNSCFGHTFTNLPDGILGATLEIRLKAVTEPGAELQCNDLINLQTTGTAPPFMWTRRLGSEGAFGACAGPGLVPFPWVEGTDNTFVLDLSQLSNADGSITNLIPFLNVDGRLDIRVNDDTGVDYVRLILVHQADCNDNGLPDFNEITPIADGFQNGDFSAGSLGWPQFALGDGSIVFDGSTLTVTSRDDGGLGITSTEQGIIQLAGDIFEFDLVSYTSTDVILWDFPVVIINDVSYGLNHDGTLSIPNGSGTIRNDSPVLSPLHFTVDAFLHAGIGPKTVGFGVRTLNGSGGPGVAVYDNVTPVFTAITDPNCNLNDRLDVCEISDSYSGFANGAFDSLADDWLHAIRGSGSVQYDGRVQVTGDDVSVGGVNHVYQDVLDLPGGTMEFDLISYTSTDIGLSDLPVIMIDGVSYGLNHDGTLSAPTGIGTIRNDSPALTPIHFTVDVESLSGPGAHEIGLGVRTLTGIGGPGVAIFDNVSPGLVQMVLDCDLNGILDSCEIVDDPGLDLDVNGLLDVCECQPDCAAAGTDGQVDVLDLIDMLANWGPSVSECDFVPPGGDGQIDVLDLIDLLAAWGGCP